MDLLPYGEYAQSLNRKRTAAGVLFRDKAQRVLLVETSYKPEWEIPGGAVEADETPWATAVREVREELGIDRPLGRLLAIDYVPADEVMPEGLAFIWDGGIVTAEDLAQMESKDPEIVSVGLYKIDEAAERVKPVLARRLIAALEAVDQGGVALCEAGHRVG